MPGLDQGSALGKLLVGNLLRTHCQEGLPAHHRDVPTAFHGHFLTFCRVKAVGNKHLELLRIPSFVESLDQLVHLGLVFHDEDRATRMHDLVRGGVRRVCRVEPTELTPGVAGSIATNVPLWSVKAPGVDCAEDLHAHSHAGFSTVPGFLLPLIVRPRCPILLGQGRRRLVVGRQWRTRPLHLQRLFLTSSLACPGEHLLQRQGWVLLLARRALLCDARLYLAVGFAGVPRP
mmetsp:Transcript_18400/g.32627  ORF Transcript_18400/g.32627 Transcript_18400/m.32627 type:complete len:232 (+) Transcript_18400:225-920(+)